MKHIYNSFDNVESPLEGLRPIQPERSQPVILTARSLDTEIPSTTTPQTSAPRQIVEMNLYYSILVIE